MLGLFAFIVVLGFLIFVHELGHFIAARRVGVRVETFSLGFGPRLFGFKHDGTDFRVSLVPLGGYVKMAGEDPEFETEPSDAADGSSGEETQLPEELIPPPAISPRAPRNPEEELNSKSIPQRFLVYFSGAAMNAVVALVLTAILGYIGTMVPRALTQPPTIGWVKPGSLAAEVGFMPGDLIVAVGDTPVDSWEATIQGIYMNPRKTSNVTVKRDSGTQIIPFQPGENTEDPFGGITYFTQVLITSVAGDTPAKAAGLEAGDRFISVNGEPVRGTEQLLHMINHSDGEPLSVEVERNSDVLRKTVVPRKNGDVFQIGISFDVDKELKKYGALDAVKMSFVTNARITVAMLDLLGKLVTRQASIKSLGGPVMIGVMANEAAKQGFRELISLTSIISLNLAILNLLPIPVLDGGLILFLLFEAIRRKPLREKTQLVIQNVFLILLLMFIIVVTYNDVLRFAS